MTIDLYRIMSDARTKQGVAWSKYERLVKTPGATQEERINALRLALASDTNVSTAEYNWRKANDLPV